MPGPEAGVPLRPPACGGASAGVGSSRRLRVLPAVPGARESMAMAAPGGENENKIKDQRSS